MCEYCERDKILKSCNFCGSAKMRISVSKEMQILEVQGEKEKFSLFKRQYCPRFDIKFCPMCGRNLKNDKCVKSANNYSLNKLKAEVDRLNKITGKLEEENELRKKHLAGEAHKLITDIRIYEEDIKWRRKFWKEQEKQKMLDLFERRKI